MRVRISTKEVDMASSGAFQAEVVGAIDGPEDDGGPVVLDFRDVEYIDSSGLAAIAVINARLRSEDRLLTVADARPLVHRVFTITGLQDFLDEPSEGSPPPSS